MDTYSGVTFLPEELDFIFKDNIIFARLPLLTDAIPLRDTLEYSGSARAAPAESVSKHQKLKKFSHYVWFISLIFKLLDDPEGTSGFRQVLCLK
jgi:hypothetical protein